MASKTFLVGLAIVLKKAKKYMTSWQTQLHTHMTTEQYTCLLSTITAVTDCLVLLGIPE